MIDKEHKKQIRVKTGCLTIEKPLKKLALKKFILKGIFFDNFPGEFSIKIPCGQNF